MARPKRGESAPDFSALATDGSPLGLRDFRGRKLVLYFYPMDDTPGCTAQACSLRDQNTDIAKKGAAILGVSTQDVASHQRFTAKHRLNFPLLAVVEAGPSWFGLPPIFVYLFGVWAGLIVLLALIVERGTVR